MKTAIVYALDLALLVAVCWLLFQSLRPHFKRRPERTEECATCGKQLPISKMMTFHNEGSDDRRLGIVEGGTLVSATYCRKHAPEGGT